jgi:hypothetical protein
LWPMSDISTRTDPPAPPPAGWYPDPWDQTQHRFWNGATWTAETFPNGPMTVAPAPDPEPPMPAAAEPPAPPVEPDPDPGWALPSSDAQTLPVDVRAAEWSTPTWSTAPRTRHALPSGRALAAIALVIGLLVGFGVAFAIGTAASDHSKSTVASPTPTFSIPRFPRPTTIPSQPTAPPGPADPASPSLSRLILQPADVVLPLTVAAITGGDQTVGEATLDLCNGTFASETQRSARRQVSAVDDTGSEVLSTEAVLYKSSADTAQAFTELKNVASKCPATPVQSPVGEATVATHFNAAPDGTWPQTATVERLAYDFTATGDFGSQHAIAVYLRRGRVLMGVYFQKPDGAQPPIAGQTTVAGIVGVFAGRMAHLPASAVSP